MPNAHVKKKSFKNFPFEEKDFFYDFIANSKYDDLVFVRHDKDRFFLKIIEREDRYLIKADKLTKPASVKIVQDAIKNFIEANDLEIIHTNIESKKVRSKKLFRYKKDLLYYENYKTKADFEIEIGFGSGRHILHQAKKFPDKEFVGIEIHRPSIEQLSKQCELQNIENISIVDYDARIFLQMLSSNSVDVIYIHFPVPWDKKPHRRVIGKSFLKEVVRVLKKGGRLELRTDSENYFNYSKELFLSLDRCELNIRKNIKIEVSSKYEDRWSRKNKDIYDIILKNYEFSREREEYSIDDFQKNVSFSYIYDKFKNHTEKKRDHFVHFENIYKIDENEGVIKLSFGSYDKSEHRYILIRENRATYLPESIIPTIENFKSHQIIKEYLYE